MPKRVKCFEEILEAFFLALFSRYAIIILDKLLYIVISLKGVFFNFREQKWRHKAYFSPFEGSFFCFFPQSSDNHHRQWRKSCQMGTVFVPCKG